MRNAHTILIACLLMSGITAGQTNVFRDRIRLQTDQQFYIAGEKIWFSAVCLAADGTQLQVHSKILYIELLSSKGVPVVQLKSPLINGIGSGSLELGTSLPSGRYIIRAYTRWMRNFGERFYCYSPVYIKNTFLPQEDPVPEQQCQNTSVEAGKAVNELISISGAQQKYGKRQQVNLQIAAPVASLLFNSGYSIVVHKADQVITRSYISEDARSAKFDSGFSAFSPRFLPELRGNLVTGLVSSRKNGMPAIHARLSISIIGKSFRFYWAVTDGNGKFSIDIPDLYGDRELIVNSENEDDLISLDEEFAPPGSIPSLTYAFAQTKMNVHERHVAAQVQLAYQRGSSINAIESVRKQFLERADEVILLDQYARFPTMEEVFRELVHTTVVRRSGAGYYLKVQYDNKGDFLEFLDNPPVVPETLIPRILLDGLPVTDNQKLFDYDQSNLSSISVVAKPFYIGDILYNGLISLQTYNGDLAGYQLDTGMLAVSYKGLCNSVFNCAGYHTSAEKESRVPDYRELLHWQPNLYPDSSGKAEVSFFTGDLSGNFIAEVHSITAEGLPCVAHVSFIVE